MFDRFKRKSKDEKVSPEMKRLLEEEEKLQEIDPDDDDFQEKIKKIRDEYPIKDEEMTPELERLLEQQHKLEFDGHQLDEERAQQLETLVEQIRELADSAVDCAISGDLVAAKIGLDRLEQVRIDTENWSDASNFASRQINRLRKAIDDFKN